MNAYRHTAHTHTQTYARSFITTAAAHILYIQSCVIYIVFGMSMPQSEWEKIDSENGKSDLLYSVIVPVPSHIQYTRHIYRAGNALNQLLNSGCLFAACRPHRVTRAEILFAKINAKLQIRLDFWKKIIIFSIKKNPNGRHFENFNRPKSCENEKELGKTFRRSALFYQLASFNNRIFPIFFSISAIFHVNYRCKMSKIHFGLSWQNQWIFSE